MADVTGHSLYTLVWQLKQFISTVSLWHVSTWMVYLGERLKWAEHFYIGCFGNDNITNNINNSTSLTLFLFLSSIWVVLQQWVHENKHNILCLHHQKEIQAYFEFLEKYCQQQQQQQHQPHTLTLGGWYTCIPMCMDAFRCMWRLLPRDLECEWDFEREFPTEYPFECPCGLFRLPCLEMLERPCEDTGGYISLLLPCERRFVLERLFFLKYDKLYH